MKNTGSSETLYKPRQLHAVYKMTVCLNTTLISNEREFELNHNKIIKLVFLCKNFLTEKNAKFFKKEK